MPHSYLVPIPMVVIVINGVPLNCISDMNMLIMENKTFMFNSLIFFAAGFQKYGRLFKSSKD